MGEKENTDADDPALVDGVTCRTWRLLRGHSGVRPAGTNLPLRYFFDHFFSFLRGSQCFALCSAHQRHFPKKPELGNGGTKDECQALAMEMQDTTLPLGTLTSCRMEIGPEQIS